MGILLARVVIGSVFLVSILPARAQTPATTPRRDWEEDDVVRAIGMDVWTDLEDAIRMICIVVGCHLDRSGQTSMLSGDLEADGWRVTIQYQSDGVRQDLTPQEVAVGSAAALRIVSILSANPTVVSEELKIALSNTASNIHDDLMQ